MLDTFELIKMQFSKDGVVGTIEQYEDGRYKITFNDNVYIFEYEHFKFMEEAVHQFTLNKRIVDFDNINRDKDIPF